MKTVLIKLKEEQIEKFNNFLKSYFGARIVKTALATTLAFLIAHMAGLRMPSMAGFAALISMKSSIFDSYKASYNRLLSTVVGAIIASFFHYIGFRNYMTMFIGITLIINVCNYFKWKDSTTLAVMVFITVFTYEAKAPDYFTYWQYGINRLMDTAIGLGIGFLINYIIFPPNRWEFIIKTYEKSLAKFEKALLHILNGESVDLAPLVSDIDNLNTELMTIRKENKFGTKNPIIIYQLSKMNSQFYSAFGTIAQFSEDGRVPLLSENNKQGLKKYFRENITVDTEIYPMEFETAFNYYLDELLAQLFSLRDAVKGLKIRLRDFGYISE